MGTRKSTWTAGGCTDDKREGGLCQRVKGGCSQRVLGVLTTKLPWTRRCQRRAMVESLRQRVPPFPRIMTTRGHTQHIAESKGPTWYRVQMIKDRRTRAKAKEDHNKLLYSTTAEAAKRTHFDLSGPQVGIVLPRRTFPNHLQSRLRSLTASISTTGQHRHNLPENNVNCLWPSGPKYGTRTGWNWHFYTSPLHPTSLWK